jgi:hypothetical protein
MEERLNELERRLAVAERRGQVMFLLGFAALAGASEVYGQVP